jgi:hypothetical protein
MASLVVGRASAHSLLLVGVLPRREQGRQKNSVTAEQVAAILRAGQEEWTAEAQKAARFDAMLRAGGHIQGKASKRTKAPDTYLPTLAMEVGSVGVLRSDRWTPAKVKIVQVIDQSNLLVRASPSDTLLWLSGFPTGGLTDGKTTTCPNPVVVSGTRRYSNTLGSTNTVLVVEPFSVDDEILQEAKKLAKKPAKKSIREPASEKREDAQ